MVLQVYTTLSHVLSTCTYSLYFILDVLLHMMISMVMLLADEPMS